MSGHPARCIRRIQRQPIEPAETVGRRGDTPAMMARLSMDLAAQEAEMERSLPAAVSAGRFLPPLLTTIN